MKIDTMIGNPGTTLSRAPWATETAGRGTGVCWAAEGPLAYETGRSARLRHGNVNLLAFTLETAPVTAAAPTNDGPMTDKQIQIHVPPSPQERSP